MVYKQSYAYFSIEIFTILLDVYDSLENPGTMDAACRTGIISVIYKFII